MKEKEVATAYLYFENKNYNLSTIISDLFQQEVPEKNFKIIDFFKIEICSLNPPLSREISGFFIRIYINYTALWVKFDAEILKNTYAADACIFSDFLCLFRMHLSHGLSAFSRTVRIENPDNPH